MEIVGPCIKRKKMVKTSIKCPDHQSKTKRKTIFRIKFMSYEMRFYAINLLGFKGFSRTQFCKKWAFFAFILRGSNFLIFCNRSYLLFNTVPFFLFI